MLLWKNTNVLWEKLWYFTENYETLINYESNGKNYGTIVNYSKLLIRIFKH